MPNLRILNISGNTQLTTLPIQLTTCDSLVDIILDAENILYPPNDIIEHGTRDILKYLLEHSGSHEDHFINTPNKSSQNTKRITATMLETERGRDVVRELNSANNKYSREKVCFVIELIFTCLTLKSSERKVPIVHVISTES